MKRLRVPIDRHADDQITEVLRNIVLVVPYRRHDPNATSHSSSTSRTHRQSGLYPVVISYSEERNTKTATVTATPTPTPKPAPDSNANANVSHRCTDTCTKYNTNEYAQRQSSYAPA
jgi:hypothetical protein